MVLGNATECESIHNVKLGHKFCNESTNMFKFWLFLLYIIIDSSLQNVALGNQGNKYW